MQKKLFYTAIVLCMLGIIGSFVWYDLAAAPLDPCLWRSSRDWTMKSLETEIAETQRQIALGELSRVPCISCVRGWYNRDRYMRVLCLMNTNIDDWKNLREDAILSISERAVPYTSEASHFCAVIYIASVSNIWRVEVDSALEEKIWGTVNRHEGLLDKCSAKELWNLLSKEATRDGQLTTETWQYISGPF